MKQTWCNKIVWLMVLIILLSFITAPFCALAKDISINKANKIINEPFEISNMFPGDTSVKEFNVSFKHKDLALLCFKANVKEDTKNLANALNIKIEITNKNQVLYDGTMANMPEKVVFKVQPNENEHLYKITLSLDTSVGNEYQFAKLLADFIWWYEPYEEPTQAPTTIPPTIDDDNSVDSSNDHKFPWDDFSPSTGLVFNMVVIISVSVLAFLIILIPIILKKKRKNEDE